MTYLNNAATTYPKPPAVVDAVARALREPPVDPGRSSGREDVVAACRRELAHLLSVNDPSRVILTPSATHALNLVIRGLLSGNRKAHIVTTNLEHNSVLRPLEHLVEQEEAEISYLAPDDDGRVSALEFLARLRDETALIAVNHASNVTGSIQPVESIADMAAEAGIPCLIDCSQSAGCVDLDYSELPGKVFVALAGHKGLYGPTGTGALVVPDEQLTQLLVGGTGIQSERRLHPPQLPLRHEAGTPNLPGLAGLAEGVRFVRSEGVHRLGEHRAELIHELRGRLGEIEGVRRSPLAGNDGRAGVVSFTIAGWDPEDLGFALHESFGIVTRSGLHCAPRIHSSLGTTPRGNVRISVGAFNTMEDVSRVCEALEAMSVSCAR